MAGIIGGQHMTMDAPSMPAALHAYPEPLAMPAMPAMPTFAPTPGPSTGQQQQDATDRARAYKSRNKRPCDFCRYKKAACHLEHAPPCELCLRYGKDCTFVESPAKRRRPTTEGNSSGSEKRRSICSANGLPAYSSSSRNNSISLSNGKHNVLPPFGNGAMSGSMDLQTEMMSWQNNITPYQMESVGISNGLGTSEFPLDPAFYQEPLPFEPFEPMSAGTMNSVDMKTPQHQHRGPTDFDTSPHTFSLQLPTTLSLPVDSTSGEPSLDDQPSSNATIVGLSGESDPYLLSRFRFDQYNEAKFQQVRVRKMNDGPGACNDVPAFFTIQHNALASKAQPSESPEVEQQYRRQVEEMVSDEVGKRLIRLFYRYVQPYYPVLGGEGGDGSREEGASDPSALPTCVLAAIYGHALPFCAFDEVLCVDVYTPPSPEALFRIAYLAAQAMCHTPNLAVVETFLLMVQRRPTNKHVSDTPVKGIMWTNAVSIAQSLGLNRDPSDWPLPEWEIRHRRRLAWATYVQDKWLALNSGRGSHLHAEDWDVSPLTEEDFDGLDKGASGPGTVGCQHFIKLCELSVIVDDILRGLFSIKATKRLQHSLEATLEAAKPLRIRLSDFHQSLISRGLLQRRSADSPDNKQHELDGNGSLQLAYITANIEIFRAMLRPQVADPSEPAVAALRAGAIRVAKDVFEFLEGLSARHLEAFWASYARTNFTIASNFILLLFVTAPNLQDAQESLNLLLAWRSLLRIKSRSCDLLNLALLRLDGVFVAGIDKLIELSPSAMQAWAESGQGKA